MISDVGAGLSFSKNVVPAPVVPPPPPPTGDTLDITTMSNAQLSTQTIDAHLETLTDYAAIIGSTENHLQYQSSNLMNLNESTSTAMSRIADSDYAKETVEVTKNQVLQQASMAMLAHSNEMPERYINTLLR
ncbi:flagellin [Thiomicrorhabdus sp. Kp2]|uniref:flagellin n=1 Tax=Thiomicrorhabdus sp. Kp2 TaxID=1123518 RepID=UPI0006850896|nr:flagellin [Thiomicrorhabdus sp. Kp2]